MDNRMSNEGPERFSSEKIGMGGGGKMFNGLELTAKDRSCPFWYITGTLQDACFKRIVSPDKYFKGMVYIKC